ncbi:MAG: ABC transporter substrate-binding protein [Armatimonadota bacterium]
MVKWLWSLLIVLAMLLAASGWWLIAQRNSMPTRPVVRIVLGAETVPHASPVWIAEHQGYFKQEGVEVEIREFDSGRTALFTMVDQGGIDMATAAQTPVVAKSFGRNNYAIIANMMSSDKDVKLLARRDRGIREPRDLQGKRVGMTRGSSGHFFLGLFLAYHQLQLSDVNLRDLEATRLGDALVAGQVDAVATWEPHIYRARKALGDNAVLLPSSNIYREDFYFIARKAFIDQHPEALQRFLRAIEKGQQFIRRHRAEAKEIVQRRLQIDRDILDATWDEFQFSLSLDQSILMALEDEARWAMENKLTTATRAPNYLDYLYPDALLVVKPTAVTIAGRRR